MPSPKNKKKPRVRFAPSPTGFLHIGGLRTALYNYLFAQKNGGIFILRIEDTDQARVVEGGLENIVKTLKWCGLDYGEGPYLVNQESGIRNYGTEKIIEKGDYGPYIQSKRLGIYQKYAEQLVKKGKAYYCLCTPERLKELRGEQIVKKLPTQYDGLCRTKKLKNVKTREPYVIRLKVPARGKTSFNDVIHSKVEFENKLIDDQVLLKSDGFPTYHLANVVDDHLMKITHVIRGDEWLPSTPKHVLLYKAFLWKAPVFAHLPLLLNSDHSKLSKRHGDVAVEEYVKKGYLKEALLNFVALLGWNPTSDQELFSLQELENSFDLTKINKGGAVVNFEKLDWMNGYYIRTKNVDKLTDLCIPYLTEANLIKKIPNPSVKGESQAKGGHGALSGKFQITETGEEVIFGWIKQIVALEQERLKKLSDISYATEFFFVDLPRYEPNILRWKDMKSKAIGERLKSLYNLLKELKKEEWMALNLEKTIKNEIARKNLGMGEVLWPLRVALSGRTASPPPFAIAEILGKEKTLKRIDYAIKLAEKII